MPIVTMEILSVKSFVTSIVARSATGSVHKCDEKDDKREIMFNEKIIRIRISTVSAIWRLYSSRRHHPPIEGSD